MKTVARLDVCDDLGTDGVIREPVGARAYGDIADGPEMI